MWDMLEVIYVVGGLGVALWLLMGGGRKPRRRVASRARTGVRTFPATHRPRRRRTIPLSVALAYYAGRALAGIERLITNLQRGWRAGRVMSRSEGSIPETPQPTPAETFRNGVETTETVDHPSILDHNATEQIQLDLLAKLLDMGVIRGETRAIEATFDVSAGGSKEYQRLRSALKVARGTPETLDTGDRTAAVTPSA